MICPNCGKKANPEDRICPGCGRELPKKEKSRLWYIGRAVLALILCFAVLFVAEFTVLFAYQYVIIFETIYENGYTSADLLDAERNKEITTLAQQVWTEKYYENLSTILIISNLLAILAVCLFFTLRRKNPLEKLSFRRGNPMRYLSFALFGMALYMVVNAAIVLIPFPASWIEDMGGQYEYMTEGSLLISVLSASVFTPIAEEIFYRVIPIKTMKPAVGTAAAIIISSAIFGFAHGTPIAVCYATVLGVVFALMYNKYSSVIPSIIAHAAFNATAFILDGVPSTMMPAVILLSVVVLIVTWRSIFIRYPTFSDAITDDELRKKPINDLERRINNRIEEVKRTGEIEREELDRMGMAWTKNRTEHKLKMKYGTEITESKPEDDSPEAENITENNENTTEKDDENEAL